MSISPTPSWQKFFSRREPKEGRELFQICVDKRDSSKAPAEHQSQGQGTWYAGSTLSWKSCLCHLSVNPRDHGGQYGKGDTRPTENSQSRNKGFAVFVLVQFSSYSMTMDLNYHQKLFLLFFFNFLVIFQLFASNISFFFTHTHCILFFTRDK